MSDSPVSGPAAESSSDLRAEPGRAGAPAGLPRRTAACSLATLALPFALPLTLPLAVLQPSPARAAAAGTTDQLRIALSQTPHAALLHIAAAKGFFGAEGLQVEVVPASHGKAAIDLLAQGKADLATAAEVPFVIAVMNGEPLAIAATVVSVSKEMAVVARRDRAIQTPHDLVGKKIAVARGTSGEYFLWAFLIRHKLAPDSVTLVDLPPARMAQELAGGNVDATATWQPLVVHVQAALGDQAVTFTEANAYTVTHVVVGRSAFLQERAPALEKLVRAMLRAESFSRAAPDQALMLTADRLKLDVRTLRQTWQDLRLRVDLRQSQLITLEDEARWAMARGYARRQPLPNFLPNLHLDALLAVEPGRVSVVH
jgi:ABC-type nitrate/sulfonate/bicarbonate transport system substrate-binding protein